MIEIIVPSIFGALCCWFFYRSGFKAGVNASIRTAQKVIDEHNKESDSRISSMKTELSEIKKLVDQWVPTAANPYRAKLPVVAPVPEKVYCANCKHLSYRYPGLKEDPLCLWGPVLESPVKGVYRKTRSCAPNDDYRCPDFTPRIKKPAATPPPALPPPPLKVFE